MPKRVFAASDGTPIQYRDEGRGPPLVFVHGWMMSGAVFDQQVEFFSRRRRVVVPDLRGCGDSEARPGTHHIPRYAEDLHELLRGLDLRDASLVGWSMGGGIVCQYLQRYGAERVGSVGLIDFPPRLEEHPSVADKVCRNLEERRETFIRDFVLRMFLSPPPTPLLQRLLDENAKCSAATGCEMYRAMRPSGMPPEARFPDVPAFLAFPSKGWFPAARDEFRRLFPRHVAPEFPRSRHVPFLEEPEAFNAAVESFVAASA